MPSAARAVYDSLRRDVKTLLELHPTVRRPGAGRPSGDTGPLLRATIVLIHTAWENYFEQVVIEAASAVHDAIGTDHRRLPSGTRQVLGSKKDPWALAGDAWKAEADLSVRAKVAALNTPSAKNVEEIAQQCLGFVGLLEACSWQGKPPSAVREDLDMLVLEVRGEIVHKGRTPAPLHLSGVKSWDTFTTRLVDRADTAIYSHVVGSFGAAPWT
jgi:hypothetical protein